MAGAIQVMIDMYSGRPDPAWSPSDEQIEELRRRLEESQRERRGERPEPPGLGYRGFRILNPKQEIGLPYQIQVYGGVLTVTESVEAARREGWRPEYFADVTNIHDWLLEQATERGLADAIVRMGGPRHG